VAPKLAQPVDVETDDVGEPELHGEAHRFSEVSRVAVLDQLEELFPHRGRDLDRTGPVQGGVTDECADRVGAARKPARPPERFELLLFFGVEAHAEESRGVGRRTGGRHALHNS